MKIAAKMTDLNENSANHEKIQKINGAKDCKFEFRAVQRNANLVDLENPFQNARTLANSGFDTAETGRRKFGPLSKSYAKFRIPNS